MAGGPPRSLRLCVLCVKAFLSAPCYLCARVRIVVPTTMSAFPRIGVLAVVCLSVSSSAAYAQLAAASATSPRVTRESTDIRALQRELGRLITSNEYQEALPIAERLVELSQGFSFAQRVGARVDLASLRRELDDLDGAVLEYDAVILVK